MKIAAAAQMREMDRAAIEERGIPSVLLMERAAAALAGEVEALAGERGLPRRAALFCGSGNNGGDGVACARLLRQAGWAVRAILVGKREKMTPDCREMERRLLEAGERLYDFVPGDPETDGWIAGAGVLVDALFGIGLNAAIQGEALTAVELMNAAAAPTVAADIPSGVEADTGRILGAAVHAARTVTFTLPKAGHYVGKGGLCAGQVRVASIGIPEDLVDGGTYPVSLFDSADASLPRRPRDAHKGDFGRAYILGGSVGYTGAPVLAARAAVRSGAGLVTVGVPAPIWPIAAGKLLEAMPHPLPAGKDGMLSLEGDGILREKLSRAEVCLIGPGLGRGGGVASVIRRLMKDLKLPVVLDADGINALEGHIDILDGRQGRLTILTPHDGEFARLTGRMPGEDRLGEARDFAAAHGCCLVLKGHRTITAFPDGAVFLNSTGNPGMAKGGSGDALAGMILSFLAQGLPARRAVPLAVYCHGLAGDLAAGALGEYGMTPSDLVDRIPAVLKQIEQKEE